MTYCSALQQDRLNVSSDGFDSILENIQARLDESPTPDCELVNGPLNFDENFNNGVTGYKNCPKPGPPKTLDLISHSQTDDHLLLLGEITDDPGEYKKYLIDARRGNDWMDVLVKSKQVFQQLNITQLRLLGCITAWTSEGRKTITTLADKLGIVVYGTKALLAKCNFNTRGFIEGQDVLVSSDEIVNNWMPPAGDPPLPPCQSPVLGLDFNRVPAFPEKTLADLPGVKWPRKKLGPPLDTLDPFFSELYAAVGDGERQSLPGLLTLPILEYWIPSSTPQEYHLMHVLFGWRMLAVYAPRLLQDPPSSPDPFASAAVYRVADPASFKRAMNRQPQVDIPFHSRRSHLRSRRAHKRPDS